VKGPGSCCRGDGTCLEHYRNFYFSRILLHFANGLRIILTFSGDHCGVGLQLNEETRR